MSKEQFWKIHLLTIAHHELQNAIVISVTKGDYWFIALKIIRTHCDKNTLSRVAYTLMETQESKRALVIATELKSRFNDQCGINRYEKIIEHLTAIVKIIDRINHDHKTLGSSDIKSIIQQWRYAREYGM